MARNVTSKKKNKVVQLLRLFCLNLISVLVKSLVYEDHKGLCDAVEEQKGTRLNDSVSLPRQQTSEQSSGICFWIISDGFEKTQSSVVAI